jgi:8-oxo-dGTP pyrophosphatase MutT (NUDIX family)
MPHTHPKSPLPRQIVPVPAVNGAVFDRHRRILLTRRSPRVREPGKWCLPGGHLETGESWATAMARELEEEVGLRVRTPRLYGIYSDPALTVTQERVPEGYYAQFVCAAFLVTDFENEVTPNDEVDQWDWFTADRLPEPMLKSHPIRVRDAFAFTHEVFIR